MRTLGPPLLVKGNEFTALSTKYSTQSRPSSKPDGKFMQLGGAHPTDFHLFPYTQT